MNIVFFGSKGFALYPLKTLIESKHNVKAVVSQPDREKDRRGNLLPTPTKQMAEENGIKTYQFDSVKKEGVQVLKELDADIFITASYGQLLSQEILDIPRYGVINIHASMLPAYRGSSPIIHAVLNGDKTTGVTIMQTRLSLDSGEIILQSMTQIGENETASQLELRLSQIGADLLLTALDDIQDGRAAYTPQDESKATYTAKIDKSMGKIDWNKDASTLFNQIRAIDSFTFFNARNIKILQTAVLPEKDYFDLEIYKNAQPGSIIKDKRLLVKCRKGVLEVLKLTPSGGKTMKGTDFLLGIKTEDKKRFD